MSQSNYSTYYQQIFSLLNSSIYFFSNFLALLCTINKFPYLYIITGFGVWQHSFAAIKTTGGSKFQEEPSFGGNILMLLRWILFDLQIDFSGSLHSWSFVTNSFHDCSCLLKVRICFSNCFFQIYLLNQGPLNMWTEHSNC